MGVLVATITLIVAVMPNTERPRLAYTLGEPWIYAQLISPADILINKDEKVVEQERKEALDNEYVPYFTRDTELEKKHIDAFLAKYSEGLPGISYYIIQLVAENMTQLYERGIMSPTEYSQYYNEDSLFSFMLVNANQATRTSLRDVYTTKTAYETLLTDKRLTRYRDELRKLNLNEYLVANVTFDSRRSNQAQQDIIALVPTNSGVMKQGQEIINRGEIVTEEKARMIDSYNDFLTEREQDPTYSVMLTKGAQWLYVMMLMLMFTMYLHFFRRDYMEKPRSLAMVFTLLTLFPILNAMVIRFDPRNIYILPLCLVPMFIRVFLDSRTAFMTHSTLVLLCAATVGMKFEFFFVEMVAGVVAICSLRDVSRRSQLFSTAVWVVLTSMLALAVVKFLENKELTFETLKYPYLTLILNGMLLLLTYPLMYLVEKTFSFVSPITLFELSDSNNALLRRLSEVAPGTYQHSIQVSNLAFAIATAVGAKALLVRVGALYHDIGKMLNPVFFTENQVGVNPHTNMKPRESAQVIIEHVADGLRLAKKNGVPDIISNFILTHHGNGLAKYFYNTYVNEHPGEEVDEAPFRYPGPNPFSREQAILMMADSVEAAARSLDEYTEESISTLVNRIIDTQVSEKYFQECPITFRDIATTKRVLIEKLKSIYHTRIQYPKLKNKTEHDNNTTQPTQPES